MIVVVTFSAVIYLIADLDRPQEGPFNVRQQAMADLRNLLDETSRWLSLFGGLSSAPMKALLPPPARTSARSSAFAASNECASANSPIRLWRCAHQHWGFAKGSFQSLPTDCASPAAIHRAMAIPTLGLAA